MILAQVLVGLKPEKYKMNLLYCYTIFGKEKPALILYN